MENIKEKIEEIVNKVKNDPDCATKFQENPVKAAEEIVDAVEEVVEEAVEEIVAE